MSGIVVATVSVASVRQNAETGVYYIRFADGAECEGTLDQLHTGAAIDPTETLRTVMILRGLQGGAAGVEALAGKTASYLVGDAVIARAE